MYSFNTKVYNTFRDFLFIIRLLMRLRFHLYKIGPTLNRVWYWKMNQKANKKDCPKRLRWIYKDGAGAVIAEKLGVT